MPSTIDTDRPADRPETDAPSAGSDRHERARTTLSLPDDAGNGGGDSPPDGPDGPGDPDSRGDRARTEPMAVHPLRDDDAYLVDTEGGVYVVDLGSGRCTCPDYERRGARCKHRRRVELEVDLGRVPPPGERVAACAVCGSGVFVPACERGTFLCPDHRPAVGSFVRDREAGDLLVVTGVTTERADQYETAEGRRIADYDTNGEYGDHEPVVEAVYAGNALGSPGPLDVSGRRRYGFPASRLRRLPESDRPSKPVIGL